MKKLVNIKDLSRADWLEWRRKGIGGSDAAAIVGINKWKSPLQVYMEKTTRAPEQAETDAIHWGNVLEPVVADEFARLTGYTVRRNNFMLQSDEHPWMLADLDREVITPDGRGVLECKTTTTYNAEQWEGDLVPDNYMLQVQHYLCVTGYEFAFIACLIGGQKFVYKKILPDKKIIDFLVGLESDFWRRVQAGEPPEWAGTETSLLVAMYPPENAVDEVVLIDDEVEELCREYEEIGRNIAGLKASRDALGVKIKAFLGDNVQGENDRVRVINKPVETKRVDSSAIKKAGLYDQYTTVTASKRLTVKFKEDK